MYPLLAFQDVADQTIRIEIQTSFLSQLMTWLIAGLIAGWLVGSLVRGRRMSLLASLVVGFLGAVLGGLVFTLLGIETSPLLAGGIVIRWIDLVVAFVGALIVLILVGILFGWRRL